MGEKYFLQYNYQNISSMAGQEKMLIEYLLYRDSIFLLHFKSMNFYFNVKKKYF